MLLGVSRYRKRKEWTRTLDLNGELFWYRASHSTVASTLNAGKAVRFQKPIVTGPDEANNLATAAMEIVLASSANAAASATGDAISSKERRREVIAFSTKDFPTKYAHFVAQSASLFLPAEMGQLKISLQRDYLLEQSMESLSCIEPSKIHSVLQINFLGENGIDAGGLYREWFMLLNGALVDPVAGIFRCVNQQDQGFYLNASSRHDIGQDHLVYYHSAGRFIGLAMLEGSTIGFHLALPLLKLILGMPLSWSDMEDFDPELFKQLNWLLEHDGAEQLDLDFTVDSIAQDGTVTTTELILDGRNIPVTDANKLQFVQRKFEHTLFESVSSQLYVFLKGIYQVIPIELLLQFDAFELDYLLCGIQELNVDDWEQNSLSTPDLQGSSTEKWFWQIVREMPNEYRQKLLQFATGRSRVPLIGFKGLTSTVGRVCHFNLSALPRTEPAYIRSHACFNRLDLPQFNSFEELKTNLYATLDTDFTGFTTD